MRRPTSILVLGILNIVFGCLAVLGTIITLATIMVPQSQLVAGNPVMEVLHKNPNYATFMRISCAVGIVACFVLVMAGLGLLMTRPWGRLLSIGYAAYAILAVFISMASNWYFLQPLLEQARHMRPGPQQGALIGGVIGGVAGSCVGLIYPAILLYFMFRPNVIAALQSPFGDEP